jgi:hypothetical protein
MQPARKSRARMGFVDKREAVEPHPPEPHMPTVYDADDIAAIKACVNGQAQPHQQQRAIAWFLHASRITDMSYRPGDPTATAFAEGRRAVGLELSLLIQAKVINGKQRDREHE